jgi:hypothetical protein
MRTSNQELLLRQHEIEQMVWIDFNWSQSTNSLYVLDNLHNKFSAGGWDQGLEGSVDPDKNAVKAGVHSRGLGVRPWDECGTCRHTRFHDMHVLLSAQKWPAASMFLFASL